MEALGLAERVPQQKHRRASQRCFAGLCTSEAGIVFVRGETGSGKFALGDLADCPCSGGLMQRGKRIRNSAMTERRPCLQRPALS